MTPLTFLVIVIFFHVEMTFPIGGQAKMHSFSQETEKASVANDPGNAYLEKKRGRRALLGVANGSKENPDGENLN